MAVNLIDSNDITINQTGNNIELNTSIDLTTLNNNVNQLQTQVDNLSTYSTSEKVIGTWINGKPLYRKVINFGTLPSSATTKSVAHGISNLGMFIKVSGIAINSSNTTLPIPYATTDASSNIRLRVTNTNVEIGVGYDLSAYSAYVTLQYTKTTD